MPNRKIKHIVAKLTGASEEETLDVYDVDAVHTDKIYNGTNQSSSGYVLDARQANAGISGTLGAQVSTINTSVTNLSTLVTGDAAWTQWGDSSPVYYLKRGYIVALSIAGKSSTASASAWTQVIASGLPSGYRPIGDVYFTALGLNASGSQVIPVTVRINANGTIWFLPATALSGHAVYGTICFPLDLNG